MTEIDLTETARAAADEAKRLEGSGQIDTHLLAAAREGAAELAVNEVRPDDIRHAALVVGLHSDVSWEVPTAARVTPVRGLKATVRRLVGFYARFITTQVSLLGKAVEMLGQATATRVERLEERTSSTEEELRAQIRGLEDRVKDLEQRRDREKP